jgi:hypothetical protein
VGIDCVDRDDSLLFTGRAGGEEEELSEAFNEER